MAARKTAKQAAKAKAKTARAAKAKTARAAKAKPGGAAKAKPGGAAKAKPARGAKAKTAGAAKAKRAGAANGKTVSAPKGLAHVVAAAYVVKSEPSVYSFEQLETDGRSGWEGVRNFEARNMLRAMKVGDLLLYYHSNEGKALVGLARVAREAFQDPTTEEDWSSIELVPVKRLARAVDLATLKANPILKDMALVTRGRISVTPVTERELTEALRLAGTTLP